MAGQGKVVILSSSSIWTRDGKRIKQADVETHDMYLNMYFMEAQRYACELCTNYISGHIHSYGHNTEKDIQQHSTVREREYSE